MLKDVIIRERNAINQLIAACDESYEEILSLLEKALLNEKQCADAIDLLDRKYGIHGGCSH